ncbi:hemolysin XhlA family protein [Clostridium gasigenes]|uniref:Haemolysin XhlA n=1 Tax=Clostridium gasigenes TaxID=94869 RepID=A0A1H0N6Z6_9CLOT|nr:hemolysin XhlA family protein [Clostridium gasigenes]SDO88453.1 Haemolysin XhlA [Clostridium gasigenes]
MADIDVIQEIRESLIEIKGTLKSMVETTDLKFLNFEDKIKVANNRISDLEDTNKWLWRAIGAALISALIALIINIK